MKLFLFLNVLLCVSMAECPSVYQDADFSYYIEQVRVEALNRGITIDVNYSIVYGKMTYIGHAAECISGVNGVREIRIDRGLFHSLDNAKKMLLIAHEIGHCTLGLGHTNNPKHLMNHHVLRHISSSEFIENKETIFDDLFLK